MVECRLEEVEHALKEHEVGWHLVAVVGYALPLDYGRSEQHRELYFEKNKPDVTLGGLFR